MTFIFRALFGPAIERRDLGTARPVERLHRKNRNVNTGDLARSTDKLNADRNIAANAIGSSHKKPSGWSSAIRHIKALFSGSDAGNGKQAKHADRSAPVAGAAANPPKPPPLIQLGNLPFKTWNAQPFSHEPLTQDQETNVADRMDRARDNIQEREGMNPDNCLAAILLTTGMKNESPEFRQRFAPATNWDSFSQVRGPWQCLLTIPLHREMHLSTTVINIRIQLCRIAAEHVSPEFLGKFDEAAKITSNPALAHGVTMENYWDVITAIQTLAWNELKASA